MNAAETALCRREPDLALSLALDDGELLDWALRHRTDGPPPVGARVRYLRYKPGTLVVAGVELGHADGSVVVASLLAVVPAALAKVAKSRAEAAERGIRPLAHDPGGRAILLPLLADRSLRGLGSIADPTWLAGGGEPRVLAYKPGRRAVLRVTRPDGTPAVLRLYTTGASASPHRNLAWAGATPGTPELLACDRRNDALLVRWVAGTPAAGIGGAVAAGTAIASFHHRDAGGLGPVARPSAAEIVAGLADIDAGLAAAAASLPLATRTPPDRTSVHGDLAPAQVIAGDDGITLIDLDRAGTGDPADDLADWIAATVAAGDVGTPRGLADLHADPAIDAFLDAYRGAGGPADLTALPDRLPAALLLRVPTCFRTRLPDWPARSAGLVALAGRIATER